MYLTYEPTADILMCVYMHMCICVWALVCLCKCMCLFICIFTYILMYIFIRMLVNMSTYIYIYKYAYACAYTYIYTHICDIHKCIGTAIGNTSPRVQQRRHCNTLATHLQHTATHCNTLQRSATHCDTLTPTTLCNTHLQHFCNTLQHTATHCNTLQHTSKGRRPREARALAHNNVGTATHLQHTCNTPANTLTLETLCNTLQRTATHQQGQTATGSKSPRAQQRRHCNTPATHLQHTCNTPANILTLTTLCNTLQHTSKGRRPREARALARNNVCLGPLLPPPSLTPHPPPTPPNTPTSPNRCECRPVSCHE